MPHGEDNRCFLVFQGAIVVHADNFDAQGPYKELPDNAEESEEYLVFQIHIRSGSEGCPCWKLFVFVFLTIHQQEYSSLQ